MLRSILTYSTLAIVVLWLVLSYIPRHALSLPNLAVQGAAAGIVFQWILVVSLLIFVAIQVWLLRATVDFFRPNKRSGPSTPQTFGLTLSSELFWTAIPLIMTIGLALASYRTWLSLASP